MKYLMWDVDGTLILSGGAGKDAMIKVIKDYYFLDAFDFNKSLAGRTDSDIIKSVVTRLRGRCNSAEAAGLLIRYHMKLPTLQLVYYRNSLYDIFWLAREYFLFLRDTLLQSSF